MNARRWVMVGALGSGLGAPATAEACGGGGVVSTRGGVGADTQRVILSVNDDGAGGGATTTDVVVQIGVPDGSDDYGALLPVPSEPTLDPTPISAEEFDRLDEATAPLIVTQGEGSGSGCGCLGTGAVGDGTKGAGDSSVRASQPVNIGPVTAVVLSGGGKAVTEWLGENGFAISAADEPMIEEYADGYFVALRRNEAVTAGPTSIGVRYTVAGDHRKLPLRFARVGAAPTVAFTMFIVANEVAGPTAPFEALTLEDLDAHALRMGDYSTAVHTAVSRKGDKAFVLESQSPTRYLTGLAGTRLASLFKGSTVTRLTTVVPAMALTEDAVFYTPYERDVPSVRYLQGTDATAREAGLGSLAGLMLAGAWRRRKRAPT